MNIVILGKSTYEKIECLLGVGKALAAITEKKVMIATANSYFKRDYNPWEYEENVMLFNYKNENELKQLSYAGSSYILYDIDQLEPSEVYSTLLKESHTLLFSSQMRDVIEYNKKILKLINIEKIDVRLVAYKLNELSKIKEKQLAELYELDMARIYSYYENAKDNAIMIDNSHNQVVRLKSMSPQFKAFIIEIASLALNIDQEDSKKMKEIKIIVGRVK